MVIWSECEKGEWSLGDVDEEDDAVTYQRVDIPVSDWRELVARAADVHPDDVIWPHSEELVCREVEEENGDDEDA